MGYVTLESSLPLAPHSTTNSSDQAEERQQGREEKHFSQPQPEDDRRKECTHKRVVWKGLPVLRQLEPVAELELLMNYPVLAPITNKNRQTGCCCSSTEVQLSQASLSVEINTVAMLVQIGNGVNCRV